VKSSHTRMLIMRYSCQLQALPEIVQSQAAYFW
jgi:hypothetical protein